MMVNSDEYLRIFVDPENDIISMLINCVLMTNPTTLLYYGLSYGLFSTFDFVQTVIDS